jgi:hypothetical protein
VELYLHSTRSGSHGQLNHCLLPFTKKKIKLPLLQAVISVSSFEYCIYYEFYVYWLLSVFPGEGLCFVLCTGSK